MHFLIKPLLIQILLTLGEWSEDANTVAEEEEEEEEEPAEESTDADPVEAVGGGATQISKKKAKPKDLTAHLKKEHVNIVFIGHVDAGKSTIGGRVL